jgi:hypothetical protein
MARKEGKGRNSFAMPLIWIAMLLASYFILAQWQVLPSFFVSTVGAMHWPGIG